MMSTVVDSDEELLLPQRDLGVLPAIHEGAHPHGGQVPEFGVPSVS